MPTTTATQTPQAQINNSQQHQHPRIPTPATAAAHWPAYSPATVNRKDHCRVLPAMTHSADASQNPHSAPFNSSCGQLPDPLGYKGNQKHAQNIAIQKRSANMIQARVWQPPLSRHSLWQNTTVPTIQKIQRTPTAMSHHPHLKETAPHVVQTLRAMTICGQEPVKQELPEPNVQVKNEAMERMHSPAMPLTVRADATTSTNETSQLSKDRRRSSGCRKPMKTDALPAPRHRPSSPPPTACSVDAPLIRPPAIAKASSSPRHAQQSPMRPSRAPAQQDKMSGQQTPPVALALHPTCMPLTLHTIRCAAPTLAQ